MLSGRFDDADFARYGAALARELGAPHAVMQAAAAAFTRAEECGLGAKDCAAVALSDVSQTARDAPRG